MITWFKKHFIPHRGNQHRPHFLRAKNTRTVLLAVLVFEMILFLLPTLTYVRWTAKTNVAEVLPAVISDLTNQEREQSHLSALKVSSLLTEAAQEKAQDMAQNTYFAHVSPQGKTPWHWLSQVGYQYEYAGENLAINFADSADVTEAWMNSPTHRANIVKGVYTEIGTGIAYGTYQGRSTIFVVQMYANPRLTYAPSPGQPTRLAKSAPAISKAQKLAATTIDEPGAEVLGTTSPRKTDTSSGQEDVGLKAAPGRQTISLGQNEPLQIEKLLSAPRHTTNYALYTLLAVVLAALALKFFFHFNFQHVDLLTNGLFITTVVVTVLLFNSYFGPRDLKISSGFDYSLAAVQENL